MSTLEPMQRVGPLAEIPNLLCELGASADEVLGIVGLNSAALEQDKYIRFRDAIQLLDACERATSRSDFGLLLGLRSDHRCFGLVGEIMECQATLGEALADYLRVQVGFSQGAVAYCIPWDNALALGFGIYDRHSAGCTQVYGLSMAVAANAIRRLTGNAVPLVEIRFCHRPPDRAAEYAKKLRARVLFNQEQSCVVFPNSAMISRNPRANASRLEKACSALRQKLGLDTASMSVRLRHELRPLVTGGKSSMKMAALELGFSSRTLGRRLAADGTTFSDELDTVRRNMACELLAMTDLRIVDIALALSFGTHSAFDVAFRRWTGSSPTHWRMTST